MATRIRTRAIFSQEPYSPSSIPRNQTALLLCDYQNLALAYFEDGGSKFIPHIRSIRDWALANNVAVYHCLVDAKATPRSHLKMAERWPKLAEKLTENPSLADESAALAPQSNHQLEQTFSRSPGYLSALLSPGLLEDLQKRQIKSLLVGGLSTSGCVLSTVKAASDSDFIVTVIEDACWDPTPGAHDLLVQHVFTSAAHVATFAEVQKIWDH